MDTVAVIVIIVVVLILLTLILYYLYAYKQISITNIVTNTATGTISQVGIQCASGQCVTSLSTGTKICPQLTTESLVADPSTSVCSDADACTDASLPYALNSDGSVNLNGTCEAGTTCRCTNNVTCAYYVQAMFQVNGGSIYAPLLGQRLSIVQDLISVTAPPSGLPADINFYSQVSISNPATQFCTLSNSWLNFLSPGTCNYIDTTNALEVSQCMNFNPCTSGTLAFVPTTASTFDYTQINVTPMTCVPGVPCAYGELAVWDTTNNDLFCVSAS